MTRELQLLILRSWVENNNSHLFITPSIRTIFSFFSYSLKVESQSTMRKEMLKVDEQSTFVHLYQPYLKL